MNPPGSPSRILYVINGLDPGGAEHGLLTLIRGGFFAGHELRVLALCRGRGRGLADEIMRALPPGAVEFVSDSERLSLRACLAGTLRLWRLLGGKEPADLMVLSLKQANIVGRAVAFLRPRVHCVSFEHISRYRASRGERLYAPMLRFLSRRVDEVWADCQTTLDDTKAYFSPRARRSNVVPLFVAAPSAPCKSGYALTEPMPRLAAAGRLTGRKNFDVLLRTLTLLAGAGVAARLDVFGDGPELDALRSLAAELKIADRVTFHGYVADWASRAPEFDLFLNLSDTEGFCIVVAEALNAGLPVIATNVGGIQDYGCDGRNMVKLSAPDAGAAADAAMRLLDSAQLREALGRQGRADMARQYGPAGLVLKGRQILALDPVG